MYLLATVHSTVSGTHLGEHELDLSPHLLPSSGVSLQCVNYTAVCSGSRGPQPLLLWGSKQWLGTKEDPMSRVPNWRKSLLRRDHSKPHKEKKKKRTWHSEAAEKLSGKTSKRMRETKPGREEPNHSNTVPGSLSELEFRAESGLGECSSAQWKAGYLVGETTLREG